MTQSKLKYTALTTLPNSFLTEQSVLNILFYHPLLIKKVNFILKPQSFYFDFHRILYEVLTELSEKQKVINITTIINTLQDQQLLEKIGGINRIIAITNRFENFLDLDEYIKILNEKYLRRLIIELGKQIIAWGYLTTLNLNEILEKIEIKTKYLTQQKISEKLYSTAEIMDEIFLEMKAKGKKDEVENFKTLFPDLDSILQGFEKSDLIIIAGRPSMGKTAFSLNIGKNIVEEYKIPLIIFTLEMSRQQILYRLIANHSKITSSRLKTGKMTLKEWSTLSQTMKYISKLPIFIDDNPNITVPEIRSKTQKILNQKTKNGLIIIDYLQLMKLNFKLENRVQEISYITRNLKILAKELEIPILVLSQLSRGVESRVNKRPMLSDLRESGCITKFSDQQKISYWEGKKISTKMLEKVEFKGMKPTYSLFFENNVKITLTSNHRVFTTTGWIKISQMNFTTMFYIFQNKDNFNFQLCKLNSMKYEGLQQVYEKTIPNYHNYLNEKVLLHNSIEQDADIVIMLYREDYYTEKKNKQQITELIVAKHRNGPVGTARLLFNPYITNFTDIKKDENNERNAKTQI